LHLGDARSTATVDAVLARAAAAVSHIVVIGESLGAARAQSRSLGARRDYQPQRRDPHEARTWSDETAQRVRDLLASPDVSQSGRRASITLHAFPGKPAPCVRAQLASAPSWEARRRARA